MLSRRKFLAATGAAGVVRFAPQALQKRRILTLVYDKALGGLRAVEKVVLR